jgi:hypothetical protein
LVQNFSGTMVRGNAGSTARKVVLVRLANLKHSYLLYSHPIPNKYYPVHIRCQRLV